MTASRSDQRSITKNIGAPGARIQCRDAEWLIKSIYKNSDNQSVICAQGISPFIRDKEVQFVVEIEQAAKSYEVLRPEDTELVRDESSKYRDSLLFIEAHLRRTVPTDGRLVVGHKAAMNALPYQLVPSAKALAMPRQRLLIADAVGLGKTLECGILCSELIRRGRGRRILVVTSKSMLVQFQKEFWTRFSIPLVRLDSAGIQRVRENIPTNQNPFHYYDKAIISVDTLKNDREYRYYVDNAYWDIIIIDECQNVAQRGQGAQASQRAQLGKRLATRSDTLILLSATPHDGKPPSFASLMAMLDPTAIADPEKYTPDDIKDLYVRRFRKDVKADLLNSVPERNTADVPAQATQREERVFEALKELKLPDSDAKAKAGQLFRTTLAKSMLSSPMAALETVQKRLATLANAKTPSPADQAALEELVPLLEAITPADFSKYQRLVELIRSDWRWNGRDAADRIVIFTGRRETQRFLKEHLATDLGLKEQAVVSLDGAMADSDQTKVVEAFSQEGHPIRILIATEVASEGLNLHYLSHRLVHFDIPWSLMTLQQRNGRIDRYGQKHQPLIRFMLTESISDGMSDADAIIRLLKTKDEQAQKNIGDPAVFLGRYDAADEEQDLSEAMERGEAEQLEKLMDTNAQKAEANGSGDDIFAMLMNSSSAAETESPEPSTQQAQVTTDQPMLSVFPSLWSYVESALQQVDQQHRDQHERFDLQADRERGRLELTPPADLASRYRRFPKELQPQKGERLVLSTDPQALQNALDHARRNDAEWPGLQYLWDLHPVVDWLIDRGQILYARHCAPVIEVNQGLEPGEVAMVLQGTIPNKQGVAVVQEWVAVHFQGTGAKVSKVTPFADLLERTRLGKDTLNNRAQPVPESLNNQRDAAVQEARRTLLRSKAEWEARVQPELEAQRKRLDALRSKQVRQLDLAIAADNSKQIVKDRKRADRMAQIERRFADHERFVDDVMSIEPSPYLKLIAVLHREEI